MKCGQPVERKNKPSFRPTLGDEGNKGHHVSREVEISKGHVIVTESRAVLGHVWRLTETCLFRFV